MSLRDSWHYQIETHLESGQSPTLDLGIHTRPVNGLPVLMALRRLAMARTDVTKPTAIAGGDAVFWLAALLQEYPTSNNQRLTPIAIVYGGADWATYLASQTTQIRETTLNASGIPPAFVPLFMGMQGVVHWWALQPLAMLHAPAEDRLSLQSFATGTNSAQPHKREDGVDEWRSWIGGIMAIALILFALIL